MYLQNLKIYLFAHLLAIFLPLSECMNGCIPRSISQMRYYTKISLKPTMHFSESFRERINQDLCLWKICHLYNAVILSLAFNHNWKIIFNPLTPRSDSHATSLYNIHALSNKQVMRILKCIR